MRVFSRVVAPPPCLQGACICKFTKRGFVERQFVGNDLVRSFIPLHSFSQKLQRSHAITAFGDIRLEHFTLLVNGPPEKEAFIVYPDENLVEMPGPVREVRVLHALLPDRPREHGPKAVPRKSNRLMRYVNAALVEQILDVAKREREPDIHHHRKADYLGRSFEILVRVTRHTTQ